MWGTRLRGLLPFLSGVLAALLALFIYNAFTPDAQLTRDDVNAAPSGFGRCLPGHPALTGSDRDREGWYKR